MYFVRHLRKLRIDEQILSLFLQFNCVNCVLFYAIPCLFHSCDKEMKKKIDGFSKKMSKPLTSPSVAKQENVYIKRCKTLITKIIAEEIHTLHPCIMILPHGRIRILKCRTERLLKCFIRTAIKLINSE